MDTHDAFSPLGVTHSKAGSEMWKLSNRFGCCYYLLAAVITTASRTSSEVGSHIFLRLVDDWECLGSLAGAQGSSTTGGTPTSTTAGDASGNFVVANQKKTTECP